MDKPVRQIIMVNLDVPMSIGRLSIQISHASLLAVLHMGKWDDSGLHINPQEFPRSEAIEYWLKKQFTAIAYKGWGKDMILNLQKKAEEMNLPFGTMIEDGWYTAIAVGPSYKDELDPLTKGLQLL